MMCKRFLFMTFIIVVIYIIFTSILIICIFLSFNFIHDIRGFTIDPNGNSINDTINNQSTTLPKDVIIMINTTSLSNCISEDAYENINYSNNDLSSPYKLGSKDMKTNEIKKSNANSVSPGICKIFRIDDSINCFIFLTTNQSKIPCKSFDSFEENRELSRNNFGDKGFLLADTKFDNQYSFEVIDPLNQSKTIRINMDFNEHTQSENEDINSPRLEIVRENSEGLPDMTSAKNQEIVWTGNINDFFEEPINNFANETYIAIQFNTGRHGSNEPDEERGFGALFDISGSNNPYLFEYRDDGKYVKYDYDKIKQLSGDSFVFHHFNVKYENPIFINNLTNTENVKFTVRTFLNDPDTRMVKTFIGNGSGKEVPYWTLYNVSKLKEHAGIENESGFMETVKQGSGYIIVRTDNIDTRSSSFRSFTFDAPVIHSNSIRNDK